MKYLPFLILSVLIITSCSEESESTETKNPVEATEREEVIDSTTTEVDNEALAEQAEEDSLIALMNDLEQRRQDMWFQLEDAGSDLYKFSYDYESDYEIESTTWYFTEDFQPLFYYQDFSAEGGYWTEEFFVLTDGQVSFAYYGEDEVDRPSKYYHYINTFEGGEDLVAFENKRIDEVIGYKDVYFVPEIRDYELTYFNWIEKFKAENYTPGTQYVNDQKEEQESIYGGKSIMGATVTIDSALFQHFYK